jgi:hypothetical protein
MTLAINKSKTVVMFDRIAVKTYGGVNDRLLSLSHSRCQVQMGGCLDAGAV